MVKKMYALVKWVGGEDDKKYTTGIPIDWIKNLDLAAYRSDNIDPAISQVIEWRATKKCPPAGWPVYDGYVIAVSSSNAVLENKLQALDGLLSGLEGIVYSLNQENDEIDNTGDFGDKSDKGSSANTNGNAESAKADESRPSTSQVVLASPDHLSDKNPVGKGKKRKSTESFNSPSGLTSPASQLSGVVPLGQRNAKVQLYKNKENESLAQALGAIHQELRRMRKKRSRDSSDDSDLSEVEAKEIGRKGSGITITDKQWDVAKTAKSYTAMGLSLLLSLFPMEVLLKSNLRGGSRKVLGGGNANERVNNAKYAALDPPRIEALYYTVKKRWKTSFNKAGLGIAINNKLTQLRANQKKRQETEN